MTNYPKHTAYCEVLMDNQYCCVCGAWDKAPRAEPCGVVACSHIIDEDGSTACAFWASIEEAAKEVESWPAWKREWANKYFGP